jgi:hypothetical protein
VHNIVLEKDLNLVLLRHLDDFSGATNGVDDTTLALTYMAQGSWRGSDGQIRVLNGKEVSESILPRSHT